MRISCTHDVPVCMCGFVVCAQVYHITQTLLCTYMFVHVHIFIYLILLTTYIPSYTLPVLVREENPKILGFNLQDKIECYVLRCWYMYLVNILKTSKYVKLKLSKYHSGLVGMCSFERAIV